MVESGVEMSERSIIVIGSKGVGKTTLIYRFLDKDETPKPTIAMDYSFGRKGGKSLVKDVIHVWEVGHLTSSLIAAAITGAASMHQPSHTTIIIMLDLSIPENLWSTLEDCLAATRSAIKMSYNDELIEELKQKRIDNMQKGSTNKQDDPFPLKLCIIGGKYDQFQELTLATKQLVGRTLRGVACSTGADLQYYSSKDRNLVRKMKDLLSFHGFNGHAIKGLCTDYDKPLLIPVGSDTFDKIDLDYPGVRSATIIDTVKQIYLTEYPHDPKYNETELEDPSNDPNFNEAIIDRLRSQREEEISANLHQMMEGQLPKAIVADPY